MMQNMKWCNLSLVVISMMHKFVTAITRSIINPVGFSHLSANMDMRTLESFMIK